jgi:hypothetical protein
VTRAFRDGHAETWRAADARLGWWGPDDTRRLIVATADPGTLPPKATWYLVASLPRPGGPREAGSPHPAASLAEVVRIYGIRNWIVSLAPFMFRMQCSRVCWTSTGLLIPALLQPWLT